MSDQTNYSEGNDPIVFSTIKKHPVLRYLFALMTISLLLVIFSFFKLNQIDNTRELYAFSDVATVTCGQLEALDNFFGLNNDRSDCVDNPEQIARSKEYAREPLYRGVSIVGLIIFFISILLTFYYRKKPAPNKKSKATESHDSEKVYLLKLLELKESGLLSPEEYEIKRSKFLENL